MSKDILAIRLRLERNAETLGHVRNPEGYAEMVRKNLIIDFTAATQPLKAARLIVGRSGGAGEKLFRAISDLDAALAQALEACKWVLEPSRRGYDPMTQSHTGLISKAVEGLQEAGRILKGWERYDEHSSDLWEEAFNTARVMPFPENPLEAHCKSLNNNTANSGLHRCPECLGKYWEHDTCIDCGHGHNPEEYDADGYLIESIRKAHT